MKIILKLILLYNLMIIYVNIVCFFQIFDDLLSEGLETFRLELRNTEDPNTVTTSSLVEIVDDESEL